MENKFEVYYDEYIRLEKGIEELMSKFKCFKDEEIIMVIDEKNRRVKELLDLMYKINPNELF